MKWIKSALVAMAMLVSAPAFAIDLSGSATDLTSLGLPGYLGLRLSCPEADYAALVSAVADLNLVALAYPVSSNGWTLVPMAGNATPPWGPKTPSDPTWIYMVAVWVAGDPPPTMLNGDGQPSWPNDCVANTGSTGTNSAAANYSILGSPMGAGQAINGY